MVAHHRQPTVGAIFFENQNACLKSPRMHQSSKSLWPSSRGGPEVSKTPPTCKVWMILSQDMALPKKHCFEIIKDLLVFQNLLNKTKILGNFYISLKCHNLAQNHPNCFGIKKLFGIQTVLELRKV